MSVTTWRLMFRSGTWLAVTMMVLQPQFLLAQTAETGGHIEPVQIVDVALQPGGVLQGRIVESQGKPLAATQVSVISGPQQWTVRTDAQGQFAIGGLLGSTYQIQVANHSQIVRAWAPGTAPPLAVSEVMVVPDTSTVLCQDCGAPVCGSPVCGSGVCRGKKSCLRPLILGGIIAAAIAIPIAVDGDDDPASP